MSNIKVIGNKENNAFLTKPLLSIA